jgi:alpha-mannosidase
MKFEELAILLPCHSLEDFPLYHQGADAQGLLAAWTGLWHPRLLADVGAMPKWYRADDPPETLSNRLIVIPSVSRTMVQAGWPARATNEGATVLREPPTRGELIEQALAARLEKTQEDTSQENTGDRDTTQQDEPLQQLDQQQLDPLVDELAGDFLALGYCYLTVELLTRQMRYMSNLDEVHFERESVAAANATIQGDRETAKQHLTNAFDALTEARERFYPVDAYLIDFTLLAESTLGAGLERELQTSRAVNLMASGRVVEALAKNDALIETIRQRDAAGTLGLVGGEYDEAMLPLLTPEDVVQQLRHGLACYETHLGRRPRVWGRRRCGLSPGLPQILYRFGFAGGLHFTLDDGRFPRMDQSKSRWEGFDGSALDCFGRIPLDASEPGTFLGLPEKLGETMDLDHVAAIAFVHWPDRACDYYEDLRRASCYSPVVGRFITIEEFFELSEMPGQMSRFEADEYRTAYLKQAVQAGDEDPISRHVDLARARATGDAIRSVDLLSSLMRGTAAMRPSDGEAQQAQQEPETQPAQSPDEPGQQQPSDEATLRQLSDEAALRQSLERFAAALPRAAENPRAGALVVNPLSFTRHVAIETPRRTIVEVPAMGYAWIDAEVPKTKPSRRRAPPLAEPNLLRNEHCEVRIDPTTGAIRGIYDYRTRGNRWSLQLAHRWSGTKPQPGEVWRDPSQRAVYSVMVAHSIEVTSTGPELGEIQIAGRLVDHQGATLARYQQNLQLWRGSPVLRIDIEILPEITLRGGPWEDYFAVRSAWPDSSADLRRSVQWTSQPTTARRIEAPDFIVVDNAAWRTAILCQGLPYHQRSGDRMLDTILITRGEQRRRFQLGLGIDLEHPLQHALDGVAPATVVCETNAPPASGSTGWLFHVGSRNALITHAEPIVEGDIVQGVRLRLLETQRRAGRVRLRCPKNPRAAQQTDLMGQTLIQLPIEGDAVLVDLTANEYAQCEIRW